MKKFIFAGLFVTTASLASNNPTVPVAPHSDKGQEVLLTDVCCRKSASVTIVSHDVSYSYTATITACLDLLKEGEEATHDLACSEAYDTALAVATAVVKAMISEAEGG